MINQIQEYLEENLQDNLNILLWVNKDKLIYLYQDRYEYYELKLLNHGVLLIEDKEGVTTISEIKKHIKMLRKFSDVPSVFIFKKITVYMRKRLIQERIPFIIENGQMYLPFLGLDLSKETISSINSIKSFTPFTQLIYLYFLYNESEVINATDLSLIFGISKMHATRALNDLYQLDLLTYLTGGKNNRSKFYKRISNPQYYCIGFDYLKSPVVDSIIIRLVEDKHPRSGLTALSEISMLNKPNLPVIAFTKEYRNQYMHLHVEELEHLDKEIRKAEIWSYNPKLLEKSGRVDILSLYLSLADDEDIRVKDALKEVLRGESWYKD